jgi:hypothetical protein
MVAGLPKGPTERARSTDPLLASASLTNQRDASRQTRSPDASADASRDTAIGGFSLRGGAQSIGI